jgi:phosphatidylglycerol---prolipoprotein diacylglyceryl transferase
VSILAAALYGVAYLVGVWAFVCAARRRRMATEGVWMLAGAALVGGLIGAGLAQFAFVASPGKSILGGVAGGYLTVIAAKRYFGIVRPTGDLFAFALSAGEAIGRVACFFAGCCYGKATDAQLAVWQHDEWRYPTQIYLALCAAATYFILRRFEKLRPPENAVFFLQGILLCSYRFVVEFYRENAALPGALDTAQLACLAGFAFFAYKFVTVMRAASPAPQTASA